MKTKVLLLSGLMILCFAMGVILWRFTVPPNQEQPAPIPKPGPAKPKFQVRSQASKPFETSLTADELCEELRNPPKPEEWKELTRVLLHAPDGEIVQEVKVHFMRHAGTEQLKELRDAFEIPPNPDAPQRILEIFGNLQSPGAVDIAREILNDEELPISNHLVNACAVSLARRGELADVEAIFRRLNSAGEDPEPEGSLYSDADGLMGAIAILHHSHLEVLLCAEAEGRGAATTGRARAAAAAALRNYPTVVSTTVLYQLTQTEANPMVRKQAENALAHIQRTESDGVSPK